MYPILRFWVHLIVDMYPFLRFWVHLAVDMYPIWRFWVHIGCRKPLIAVLSLVHEQIKQGIIDVIVGSTFFYF